MSEFISLIVNIIQLIYQFLINFINIILNIPKYLNYILTLINSCVPSYAIIFISLSLTVTIVYFIVGRYQAHE